MSNNNRKRFGARLKELRIRAALTQRELGTEVGVTASYLSKIEHGVLDSPSAATISKIAAILKADANELLSLAGKFPYLMSQRPTERAILEFGRRLSEFRKKRGLSQVELARQINVNPGYISKLENGKMPPPSRKVLLRLAKALGVSKNELIAIAGKAPYMTTKKKGVSQMFGDAYRSIKRNISVPNLSPSMNKGWVRVAISILLVVGIASSLWLASPTPVQALTIDITAPSTATISSPFQITVLVTVQSADILPIKSAYLDIQSSTSPGTYKARCTNLPLTDGGTSTSISALGTSGTSGTVSIAAVTGSNWVYWDPTGSRSGYGYGYGTGWNTYDLGNGYGYGYGYGGAYTGGSTTITYTVNWTPPSGWPTGETYEISAFVVGSGTVSFTNPTATTFTLSAAAAAPAPVVVGDGVPSVPSSEDVSDIVNEDGVFTKPATVKSADGKAFLSVTKGTVGLTAEGEPLSELTITNVRPPAGPPAGAAFTMGIHFDFEPSGATFDPPALLTFEYNPNWLPPGATPDNLTIAYYDEDTGRWVELGAEDIEIDPTTNTITARVSHFTVFSILVRINPAAFEVSGLKISPTSADVAERVTISATMTNTGDLAGSYEVVLKINGQPVSFKKISVAGGGSEEVTFTTVQGSPGSYKVDIDGLSGTLTVKEAPVKPVVITSTVPSITAPAVEYPAPTAPAPLTVPAPVPAPTPWLAIIVSLVVTAIVAGIVVWYFGFRRA